MQPPFYNRSPGYTNRFHLLLSGKQIYSFQPYPASSHCGIIIILLLPIIPQNSDTKYKNHHINTEIHPYVITPPNGVSQTILYIHHRIHSVKKALPLCPINQEIHPRFHRKNFSKKISCSQSSPQIIQITDLLLFLFQSITQYDSLVRKSTILFRIFIQFWNILLTFYLKTMQMRIRPSHSSLQNIMQLLYTSSYTHIRLHTEDFTPKVSHPSMSLSTEKIPLHIIYFLQSKAININKKQK